MMELQVQKALRSGKWSLQRLKDELSISVREDQRLGVVCLNYNQILSPMTNPIVQECRALVLDSKTWDVRSWVFGKFFNLGEGHIPKDFDWNAFKTYEKLDGSLIHFWYHDTEGWQCGTRSVPDANTGLDDTGLTFKQLVLQTMAEMGTDWSHFVSFLDPNYCYAFELTTPENQVVVEYPQRMLTLLAARNLKTLQERSIEGWIGTTVFPSVKLYSGWNLDAVKQEVQGRDPKAHEGFVLVDQYFNRIKVKSEAYVFMSSRKDSLQKSNKARIELILADAADDVMPSLPVYIQDKIKGLQNKLRLAVAQIDQMWAEVKDIESDRDFALKVQHSGLSTPMFSLRKGKAKDGLDFLKRTTPKRVLEYLNETEEESND
jgi:hypothetical protein